MTFGDFVASWVLSSPRRIYKNIKESVLPSARKPKRRRDDGTDPECIELQPRPSRQKVSDPSADGADAHRQVERLAGAGEQARPRPAPGRVHQLQQTQLQRWPQTPYSTPHRAYEARRYGADRTGWGKGAGAVPHSLQLYGSIARRHGPQSSFRHPASPAQQPTPPLDPAEAADARDRVLQDIRKASATEADAVVQKKQAVAARAAGLYKLAVAEQRAAAVGEAHHLSSALTQEAGHLSGAGGEQLRRRLDMDEAQCPLHDAGRPPLSPRADRRPARASLDTARPPAALPSQAQQQAAGALQLAQEQEDKRKGEEQRRQQAKDEREGKARLAAVYSKIRELSARADEAMAPTTPAGASKRSLVTARAAELKMLEAEKRRLEDLRGAHARFAAAVAAPLPDGDGAVPGAAAPPPVRGPLADRAAGKAAPGDAHARLRLGRGFICPLSPKRPPGSKTAAPGRARQQQQQQQQRAVQENGAADEEQVVLLSSDEEEAEEQAALASSGAQEWEDEDEDEQDEDQEGESAAETSLSEALEGVAVRDDNDEAASGHRRLTKAQKALAARALAPGDGAEILVHHAGSNIEMTRRLMACLRGTDWLNDEVINIYMGLLQDRDMERRIAGLGPRCHFFSSFFLNKLYKDASTYNYQNVRRWTLEKKLRAQNQLSKTLAEVDRILMPVHLGNHWTCALVDLASRQLRYYDSFGGKEEWVMTSLRAYVADEARNKADLELDTSAWPISYVRDVPLQNNGCDCGVFALAFAEHLSRDAPLDFHQRDMPFFRQKIAADIMALRIS